jgi:hypothetical protein
LLRDDNREDDSDEKRTSQGTCLTRIFAVLSSRYEFETRLSVMVSVVNLIYDLHSIAAQKPPQRRNPFRDSLALAAIHVDIPFTLTENMLVVNAQ